MRIKGPSGPSAWITAALKAARLVCADGPEPGDGNGPDMPGDPGVHHG